MKTPFCKDRRALFLGGGMAALTSLLPIKTDGSGPSGNSLRQFINAAGSGDLSEVRRHLDLGVDIDGRDNHLNNDLTFRTALWISAKCGRTPVVSYLLSKGASPDLRPTRHALTPLCVAANARIAMLLLEYGADPNPTDFWFNYPGEFYEPINLALWNRMGISDYPVFKVLIENGALPIGRLDNGTDLLCQAILENAGVSTLELILPKMPVSYRHLDLAFKEISRMDFKLADRDCIFRRLSTANLILKELDRREVDAPTSHLRFRTSVNEALEHFDDEPWQRLRFEVRC